MGNIDRIATPSIRLKISSPLPQCQSRGLFHTNRIKMYIPGDLLKVTIRIDEK
jgi:hypothetical protein